MGTEIQCNGRSSGRESVGKALLETSEVLFRGDFRVALKFGDLTAVDVDGGTLRLSTTTQTLELDLGPKAPEWREKILNPKSLLDKLAVKPGMLIAVIDVDDAGFLANLARTGVSLVDGDSLDLIFYAADSEAALARLTELKDRLAPKGGVWVVSRKGKAGTLKDVDVIAAGRGAGLVDVKVASFSSTHTALKFVRPKQ